MNKLTHTLLGIICLLLASISWQLYIYRPVTEQELLALIKDKSPDGRERYVTRYMQRALAKVDGEVGVGLSEPIDVNVVNEVDVSVSR